MATTEEVLQAARNLGSLIRSHEAADRMQQALEKVRQDTDAQRLLNDYNRHLEAVAEKDAQGKPIEVEDKRKLEQLQNRIATTPALRDFQLAQMDYVDLMRQVDQAISDQTPPGSAPGSTPAPGSAPGIPGSAPGSAPGSGLGGGPTDPPPMGRPGS